MNRRKPAWEFLDRSVTRERNRRKRAWELIDESPSRERRYPLPLIDVDLSGRVKMVTLERLLGDWSSAEDLYQKTALGAEIYKSGVRAISIRLLRYYRQGLLRRRRKGKKYEYKLSEKGEDRLLFLWDRFKCLEPPPGWEFNGRLGQIQKELAENRRRRAIILLELQIQRDERKLRLRDF